MKYKNYYIIISAVCVILILVFMYLIVRRNRQSTATQSEVTPAVSSVVPTSSQSFVTPVTSSLTTLKQSLTQPVIYKDLTIEYRKKSDTFVIFFSGDKQQAEETVKNFFKSNNVFSLEGLKIDYESLDMTLPPHG
jgi:hypothetical protein